MRRLFALMLLGGLSACSLFHQDKGNEPPTLALSRSDTLRVGHGGRISLEVRADDEDDDELFYRWDALGAGTFSAPEEASTFWVAPDSITGTSSFFVLTVTVRDRNCEVVTDPQDHQRCQEAASASQLIETFLVEVLRTAPSIDIAAFATASFADPLITIEAAVTDEDGDPLEVFWQQTAGEEILLFPAGLAEGSARLQALPFLSGEYTIEVRVTDGSDTTTAQTRLQVTPQRLPTDAMQRLTLRLADGSLTEFEIDRYEYPNERAAAPLLVDSYFAAQQLCVARGKRLCTAAEWTTACQGEALATYSSTDDPARWGSRDFGLRFCNTPGSALAADGPAPAGSFPNCAAAGTVFDLTGNAAEWVQDTDATGQPGGRLHASDTTRLQTCTEFEALLAPLPPNLDPANPPADSTYNAYYVAGNGFRCCR